MKTLRAGRYSDCALLMVSHGPAGLPPDPRLTRSGIARYRRAIARNSTLATVKDLARVSAFHAAAAPLYSTKGIT